MDVTPSGMVTDEREEQPENAEDPMEVTLSGMITDEREEQPENAEDPMDVTPLPMMTFLTSSAYECHGTSEEEEYELMSPDPFIVRVPDESNAYVTFSPHEPLLYEAASDVSEHSDNTAYAETDAMTSTAKTMNLRFILHPLKNFLKTYLIRNRRQIAFSVRRRGSRYTE